MTRRMFMTVLLMPILVSAQDGAAIAEDPEMFSERFRVEFRDMNDTFGDFGFELELIEGERPALAMITEKYGETEDEDEVELSLGVGDRERRMTLRFYYYRDIGFGVLPSDPAQLVMVVKRRPD